MMLAGAGFASAIGVIRFLSASLHPFEIAFFRNLFGLMLMAPWVLRGGIGVLRTRRIGLYSLRAALALTAMLSWFTAVSLVPLSDAVALSFTTPIFTTVLAALVLHEVVRLRRWSAVLVGFLGVLVILRPGIAAIDPNAFIVLLSSFSFASAGITVKLLTSSEHPNAIVTWMVIFLTPLSLVPALFVWQTPAWELFPWLLAVAAAATTGHIGLTRAYHAAEATAVQPFIYIQLPFVALVGFLAFGERPAVWTWVGAAIIAGACIYIARREARAPAPGEGVAP